jgi:hypothetical protein
LHRNYCSHERDGKVPPQLLGNALMPTALESPVAGLARLAERLPLYYRCADSQLRADLAEVERALDKDGLPERCSDTEKAQMLLGYLARPDLLAAEVAAALPKESNHEYDDPERPVPPAGHRPAGDRSGQLEPQR